ncbi:MAG: 16S rRNA (uracil(1498)-N(3))-methyltransferase [Variibacter sp.]|nr:16S rRNA (uracil(1498)-N(3))-methyltransferase [Variibacter sp.]
MPAYDFATTRLFVEANLSEGAAAELTAPQAHYLLHVLRLKAGGRILVFNGRDGEWRARLLTAGRKGLAAEAEAQTRPQTPAADLHYLFAPLKHARLDYMVQKAVEMGVSRLQPVLTDHTQPGRVNTERMRANAIEAAEQCGVLSLPAVAEPRRLAAAVEVLEAGRLLIFCDESAEVCYPIAALSACRPARRAAPPLALLIGPEGGFSAAERRALLARPNVVRIALGPRILRADTAAVAALAVVQAVLGDWGGPAALRASSVNEEMNVDPP